MLCKLLFWLSCIVTFGTSDESYPKLRIIGGDESKVQYKFMISLQIYGEERNRLGMGTGRFKYHHICGGSIVGPNCIVTAAHCVENMSIDALSILVGTNNLDDELGERYYLKNYKVHHKYTPLAESDIAIIRTNETMKFSDRVGLIKQSTNFIKENVTLLLLGWGHTNPTKMFTRPPRKLQTLKTTSISNEECNKNPAVKASETDLCTYERMGKGACNGDSGGPLILFEGSEPILAAIVSRGFIVCSMYGISDVFTRGSVFVDWINEQCGNNQPTPDPV